MQLMTKAVIRKLEKYPLNSTDGTPKKDVIVKFFLGPATWYVVEGEELDNGDWLFYGLTEISHRDWGYFKLSDLQAILGQFGLGVERDRGYEGVLVL